MAEDDCKGELDRKLKTAFENGRRKMLSDDEILEAFYKETLGTDLYVRGEERYWTEPTFKTYIQARAIDQKLTLLTLEDMVQLVRRYLDMPDKEVIMGVLWSIHSKLGGWLPSELCAYLHFMGQSMTGKSHAGQFFCEIAGLPWLGAISEGALLSGIESERGVGIDEIDSNLKRIEQLEGILKIGHTWTAKYRKMVTNPETKVLEYKDVKCGGPKILTSIGPLEEALESRCYVIEMMESPRKLELSRNWVYRKDDVERIANSVEAYAILVRAKRYPEEIQKWHFSEEYMNTLKKLESCGGRRTDLAHIFLTVAWALDWDLPGIVESLAKETLDDEKEWLRTILLEIADEAIKAGTLDNNSDLKATRLLELVNEKRHQAGLHSWSQRAFGNKMTELGFIDKGPKTRKADGWYYRFDDTSRKLLQKGAPRQKDLSETYGLATEKSVSPEEPDTGGSQA